MDGLSCYIFSEVQLLVHLLIVFEIETHLCQYIFQTSGLYDKY